MIKLLSKTLKAFVPAMLLAVAISAAASTARADIVTLNDGTKYDNATVIRDEADFVIIEVIVNGKKEQKILSKSDVKSIVKQANSADATKPAVAPNAPAKDEKKAETKDEKKAESGKDNFTSNNDATAGKGKKKDDRSTRQLTGKAQRVAVLNFGPPRSWQGKAKGMVGQEINAWAWSQAVPLLEKDKIDIVVVRIHSGGGYTAEMKPFNDLFHDVYSKKFRTVTWIESAISCAAMSPWVLEEMYFLPEGDIGGCTEWFGAMQLSSPLSQAERLNEMVNASKLANRDPKIMRSMQIMEPLSATIDESGNVKFFQDMSGEIIVNRPGEILTLTSEMAEKIKFSRGTAATLEELMQDMGVSEWVLAGKAATEFIDDNIRDCTRTAKNIREVDAKYLMALRAAEGLRGDPRQASMIGQARQALNQMKRWMAVNPNFTWIFNRPTEWFEEQERILRDLAK